MLLFLFVFFKGRVKSKYIFECQKVTLKFLVPSHFSSQAIGMQTIIVHVLNFDHPDLCGPGLVVWIVESSDYQKYEYKCLKILGAENREACPENKKIQTIEVL